MPARRRTQAEKDGRNSSGRKTTKNSSIKNKFKRKLPNASTMFILALIFLCTIAVGYMWWRHYVKSRLYTPIVARRMISKSELGDMGDIKRFVFKKMK